MMCFNFFFFFFSRSDGCDIVPLSLTLFSILDENVYAPAAYATASERERPELIVFELRRFAVGTPARPVFLNALRFS